MKKHIINTILILITAVVLCGVVSAADYTVGPTETYTTIQSAVNVATDGDNINVNPNNGNPYVETVNINHDLTVKANGQVTVQAPTPASDIFNIQSSGDGTTIQGFTINGPTTARGVFIDHADNCKIINNTIVNCLDGVQAQNSNNVEISGNTISYTGSDYAYGIYSEHGSTGVFSDNTITMTGNGVGDCYGIFAEGASHKITGNTITITNTGTGTATAILLESQSGSGHNIEVSYNTILADAINNGESALDFAETHSDHAFGNNILGGQIANRGSDNHLNLQQDSRLPVYWSCW